MLWVTRLKNNRNDDRLMIINDEMPSTPPAGSWTDLNNFRHGLYSCLTRRADTLFELADAVACGSSPLTDLARLSLEIEHHRGHGGPYDGLNAGVINTCQLRHLACSAPLPKVTGRTGVSASSWPSTCRTGCGRTLRPARTGRFATPTPAVPARPR